MARITISNLKAVIADVNAILEKSGSVYFYKYEARNGYHAVDVCKNVNVVTRCLDCAEPPRVLIDRVNDDFEQYLGKAK